MSFRLATFASLTLLYSSTVWACSIAPGYATFELSSRVQPLTGDPPAAPSIMVHSIKRGYDDGDGSSCSDAGIINLEISDAEADRNIGYTFRVTSGKFEKGVLPDIIVAPILFAEELYGFQFVWLDPGGDLDFELEVRAVSKSGLDGEATILKLSHP